MDKLKKEGISEAEFSRSREQMKAGMFFANESTSSQMILYGKYMLQNNKIFNFEEKLNAINSITKEDVMEAISLTFDDSRKAVAAVGDISKAFSF